MEKIKALFLDVGGVLLTNGWDTGARKRAAEHFALDFDEMEERHRMIYDIYELGKISLRDYLRRVVFYRERPFTFDEFFYFMKEQSRELPGMIDLVKQLKKKYGLKLAVLSNEGKDLTLFRVEKFNLKEFVDYFIFSCFVHLQKPDPEIFTLALEVGMFRPEEVIYIDDRPLLVEEGAHLGIYSIHHESLEKTKGQLEAMGLK